MPKSIIPPKPENLTWTDDQWKAIHATNQDILVAAAAGSGKTAVLVERIITKILNTDNPMNVDELLVVTFTNASAAEMRHRIGEALEKAIQADPHSYHLRKQLTLLNKASISTLHSFCLEVIKKYYYLINIDPGFRIADETEAQLLRDEVLDDLFEEAYGKEDNEAFYHLVDTFTNDRSDVALQDMIRQIYDFARANPSMDDYLDKMIEMYNVTPTVNMGDIPFVGYLLSDVRLQLQGVRSLLTHALELTKQPGGPAPRADNFVADIQLVDILIHAAEQSWETLYEAMQSYKFKTLKACKGEEFEPELIEESKKVRDQAKDVLKKLKEELFSRKAESFLKDMLEMKPHIAGLAQLVKAFAERFAAVKTEKGLVDFADLEHYCLDILGVVDQFNQFIPTDAALAYKKQFKEVLVDEYQDTNMVQEAILQLVTNDNELNGNLFMVGDVKQSIYRFRLAEPNLFLNKYNRFTTDGESTGLRIDLARNFRSRKEVLHGTNFIFKQIMGENVGEIVYDEAAELVPGAAYPEEVKHPIELSMIDLEDEDHTEQPDSFEEEELAQSQLEARLIAKKIKELMASHKQVYNAKLKQEQPMKYRDVVILLRSMTWAPQMIEELKQQGIPVYADLSQGYFDATEVSIMMSLLKVIDNPYQDIPLAAVLRSPIVGLTENQLATIRVPHQTGAYYEAVQQFCSEVQTGAKVAIYDKLKPFLLQLENWRQKARQGALSDLIWQLYRETRFYDFAGGMPGGKQRQANLRALYDRARQYEATSFRGLFRFLRFIERMRERGDDLGAARALGEQEDVVRIMTIHKSKGLEFPFVFMPGLARNFNTMDLKKSFLLDKDLGLAYKYVNANKRISLASLPQLAFKRKKKMEMLAEEMRVLYVALTRAKEKLFLIASPKNMAKKLKDWQRVSRKSDWLLDDFTRAQSTSYLDWIAPAIIRHQDSATLDTGLNPVVAAIHKHPSSWEVQIVAKEEAKAMIDENQVESDLLLEKVQQGERVDKESRYYETIKHRLEWSYPYQSAMKSRSKQSVSEIKRQKEIFSQEESGQELVKGFKKPILNRPLFMQEKSITPAERGTALHTVMQHLDLHDPADEKHIMEKVEHLVKKELLTAEQATVVDPALIVDFLESELAERMRKATTLQREVPFNLALPASEVYSHWDQAEDTVLVQGIIDCLFEDHKGLVIVDYKSDRITDRFRGGMDEAAPILIDRYRVQIDLYTKAVEQITKRKVAQKYLYFFDGGYFLQI
ncbi:helicase-exonuclease AddAB subunit AddA [Cytobacillus sp. FSL M8-0252]|uniref:helicase-exonuclease AddAB subunit AddA n=1 Tax=Cytobacillus sp. FSL M8-0252 TaxID=2921621 RepID=UPI0030FBFC7D